MNVWEQRAELMGGCAGWGWDVGVTALSLLALLLGRTDRTDRQMDGRRMDGWMDHKRNVPNPTDRAVGLEAHGLQALRNVFISPLSHPGKDGGEGGTLQLLPCPSPSRPLAQGICNDEKEKPGPPHCMRWSSATKVILYLRKGGL